MGNKRFPRKRFERRNEMTTNLENWIPRTNLGKKVMANKITLNEIFENGMLIKEPEIVEKLVPGLKSEIILIGGSPGKGGGIRRTPTLRTARVHRSGRRYKITALSVVGNGNGYIGLGSGSANDHREAISKSFENAKLNIIPVRRGCGSWKCRCGEGHSIPFKASGKCGSVKITLIPAPKGAGLMVSEELKKIMHLAGISDVWSKIKGNRRNRRNIAFAVFEAFKNLNKIKVPFSLTEIKNLEVKEEQEEIIDKHKKETETSDAKTSKKREKETEKTNTKTDDNESVLKESRNKKDK